MADSDKPVLTWPIRRRRADGRGIEAAEVQTRAEQTLACYWVIGVQIFVRARRLNPCCARAAACRT